MKSEGGEEKSPNFINCGFEAFEEMKRMHETDGPKTYFQNYHHYQSNNHHHHQGYNNQNNSYSNGGGYQHLNGGSYHPGGYHNNGYRNNYSNNRRFFRSNKYFHNNQNGNYHTHHHHHHQQQYNNQHDSIHCSTLPHSQSQQQTTNNNNNSSVVLHSSTGLIRKSSSAQGIDENSLHPYRPSQQKSPLPPPTSCSVPDSAAPTRESTTKSESSTSSTCSSEAEEPQQPLPQTPINNNNSNNKNNNNNKSNINTSIAPTSSLPLHTLIPPPDLLMMRDVLSEAIMVKFRQNSQSEEIYRKKMALWKELYDLFKPKHNGIRCFSLQVVGSTMSGFGSRTSDVDVCLMIRRSEVDQRIEAVDRLHELQLSLQKLPYMDNIELIYAKVPILKFHDSLRNLDVDLNCNNSVGIRNTHLLFCYSYLDPRVKPLVLITKLWAQYHGINDAKNMTISSYSLVLMVIHYLQFACKEPVLPCLHQMFPLKFGPNVDVDKIKINEPIDAYWKSQNTDTLGDLLIGFLEYYSRKFDYSRAAVSVRLGCHLPIKICMQARSFKNDPHQWKYLCVEEPFDLTNTARSVYDKEAFDRIRGVFCASWQRLQFTRDLESIFYTITENESRAIAARLPAVILR